MKNETKILVQYSKLIRIASLCKRLMIRSWMALCRILPIVNNKIVIVNYYGKGYGDNGKAIVQKLLMQDIPLDIVWAVKSLTEIENFPPGVRFVKFRSLTFYKEMATARIWIDNSRQGAAIIKRSGQFYIQTWHGGLPLKQIEKDAYEHLARGYLDDAIYDSKKIDLMISGNAFFSKLCKTSFWYDGAILECGTPRLDSLINYDQSERNIICEKLGLPKDKKFVLYAPTFRVNKDMECYNLYYNKILNTLEKKTGDEWCFIVRLHPNISVEQDTLRYSSSVLNGTQFPDLYELLKITDLLISDYSSVIFEGALLEKPVALFTTDLDAYIKDRNFYFNLNELPFPICENNEMLMRTIECFDTAAYKVEVEKFNDSINYFETGEAASRIVHIILEVIQNEKYC